MIIRVLSVCCAFLVPFIVITDAQYVDVSSASLSKAPVGFFNRRNVYGEVESASSLSGAPVALYSRRQYPQVPVAFPQVYPYPILPYYLTLPGLESYVQPRPQVKKTIIVRPVASKPVGPKLPAPKLPAPKLPAPKLPAPKPPAPKLPAPKPLAPKPPAPKLPAPKPIPPPKQGYGPQGDVSGRLLGGLLGGLL